MGYVWGVAHGPYHHCCRKLGKSLETRESGEMVNWEKYSTFLAKLTKAEESILFLKKKFHFLNFLSDIWVVEIIQWT